MPATVCVGRFNLIGSCFSRFSSFECTYRIALLFVSWSAPRFGALDYAKNCFRNIFHKALLAFVLITFRHNFLLYINCEETGSCMNGIVFVEGSTRFRWHGCKL